MSTNLPCSDFLNLGQHKCKNVKDAFASMLTLHEETLNAWTMVFGLFVACGLYLISPMNYIFTLLFTSVMIHVPISFTYHTILCIEDERLKSIWLRLDLLMTFTASLILIYIFASRVFHTMVTTGFIVTGAYIYGKHIMNSWVLGNCGQCKISVAKQLASIVALYIIPLLYGFFVMDNIYGLAASVCVISGGTIYALQIPERWVDIKNRNAITLVGNSHQIMHITLIIAHICEYMFCLRYI